ncbi:MAG: hypothetical protein IPK52_22440 [Chloroflexi bacterium]|nr:hypothetical protein [Chloroflexota bacterium]
MPVRRADRDPAAADPIAARTAVVATLSGATVQRHPPLVDGVPAAPDADRGKGLATGLGLGGIFVARALGSAFYAGCWQMGLPRYRPTRWARLHRPASASTRPSS